MSDKARAAKGEGSFKYMEESKCWQYRLSVGRTNTGRRKILQVTAPTKTACIKMMRVKLDKWNKEKQKSDVNTKITVSSLCRNHLRYKIDNGDLKPKSQDRHEGTIANQVEKYDIGFWEVGSVYPTDIEQHIQLLINEGNLSESSISKTLDVLNAAFNWAVLQGQLERNPVEPVKDSLTRKLKKLKSKKADDADVMVLSDEEEKRFVEEACRTDSNGKALYPAGDYLLLLLETGMRAGELCGLYWSCVDLKNGIITIERNASMAKNRNKKSEDENNYIMIEGTTKNQKARTIELSEEAHHVLKRICLESKWKRPDDLVAPTLTGSMNTATNLEHRMKVIMKNAGLSHVKGGLHILRKTYATNRYLEGARVEEIAAYIGDLESTVRKYYIAIRQKMVCDGKVTNVVRIPGKTKEEAG